jgi:hypothetical protein
MSEKMDSEAVDKWGAWMHGEPPKDGRVYVIEERWDGQQNEHEGLAYWDGYSWQAPWGGSVTGRIYSHLSTPVPPR